MKNIMCFVQSASNRRFLSHPHSEDIVSEAWGSYFYATDSRVVKKKSKVHEKSDVYFYQLS